MFESHLLPIKTLYTKYERWVPIAGFVGGFLFDMMVLHRIDEPKVIIQQAIYLLISAVLLAVDFSEEVHPIEPPALLRKIWKYREFILHFLLGTLLNSYTIFYFKSASGITSFIFIFLLVAALTLSEFKSFGKSQKQVHMALWSLCLISYSQALLPIFFGYIGTSLFFASALLSILIFALFYKVIRRYVVVPPSLLKKDILLPYVVIHLIFTLLYFTHAIPPVPLSVTYMGIYHGVEKRDGEYRLSYTRPDYRFWEHGDETFEARTGDQLIAFFQIFLPRGFEQQFHVQWFMHDQKHGWMLQDTVPLTLTGGREEGFRSTIVKNNYQPGEWRVQLETLDGREIGRLGFIIVADTTTDERTLHVDVR